MIMGEAPTIPIPALPALGASPIPSDADVDPAGNVPPAAGSVPGPAPVQSEDVGAAAAPAASPGGAQEAHAEAVADPAISRAKFERELAEYRRLEHEYLRRGWFLVRAEFPEIMVVFTAPQLQPSVVLFAIILDYSNYDLWPPSVRFVDPFTRQPFPADKMPIQMLQRRRLQPPVLAGAPAETPIGPPDEGPAVGGAINFEWEHLIQAMADGRPFLCVAGVREYHEHPFHSNDPWLAHRGTGPGRLYHILNLIYRHGVAPLREIRYQVHVQPVGFAGSLEDVPERTPE